MTAPLANSAQQGGTDWTGAFIVGAPLLLATAVVYVSLNWDKVTTARHWLRYAAVRCSTRLPLTEHRARRVKDRAMAEAADWGPGLVDDEFAAWRRAVAAYFTSPAPLPACYDRPADDDYEPDEEYLP